MWANAALNHSYPAISDQSNFLKQEMWKFLFTHLGQFVYETISWKIIVGKKSSWWDLYGDSKRKNTNFNGDQACIPIAVGKIELAEERPNANPAKLLTLIA